MKKRKFKRGAAPKTRRINGNNNNMPKPSVIVPAQPPAKKRSAHDELRGWAALLLGFYQEYFETETPQVTIDQLIN